jgi:hypothetical protein
MAASGARALLRAALPDQTQQDDSSPMDECEPTSVHSWAPIDPATPRAAHQEELAGPGPLGLVDASSLRRARDTSVDTDGADRCGIDSGVRRLRFLCIGTAGAA